MKKLSMLLVAPLMSLCVIGLATAKPVKNKYGVTQNGKMPAEALEDLSQEIIRTKQGMTQQHYEDIVSNPKNSTNDSEKLAALSSREIFILVDRSGSMSASDDNPLLSSDKRQSGSWTRWDSARVAAESIMELALSMDKDGEVELVFWSGGFGTSLKKKTVSSVDSIGKMFKKYSPGGSTPLAQVLEKTYKKRLKGLLQKNEPFTVIILTDGSPDDQDRVKRFFKKIVEDHHLDQPGRETLAAFSFIRMGDDYGAIQFLEDLDDNLMAEMNIKADIVDTKEDNFLFGTGKFAGQSSVGPFVVFWDAIFD